MLRSSNAVSQVTPWRNTSICCFCAARSQLATTRQRRSFSATTSLFKRTKASKKVQKNIKYDSAFKNLFLGSEGATQSSDVQFNTNEEPPQDSSFVSLKEALTGSKEGEAGSSKKDKRERKKSKTNIEIKRTTPEDFHFEPVEVHKPPVPMLAYGLDRVLFNPGVYRLQDPRTGVYNFDPYLEKIMPVEEFDFDALSEYKTSSKDQDLLAITRKLGVKYTGSTSSMSGVLQHFHFLLSAHRRLDHSMLSKNFPDPTNKFSRITAGPDAVFLRYKDGVYAIDADKTYDTPNIMSWLGHSMEKLLTTERTEFERYRRSNPEQTPPEGDAARCFHYSKQGSVLMRSQLDARDPRLPGAGIFDLKTRAVVSIRMNHKEYERGLGYQLRYAQGEWESFEREFYDMTRSTMLKYSLQVRMGRMDGIFLAYHNIERIFGFQYLSLSEMDQVLHGQSDTCLGDQEFKLSIGLMEELLDRATQKFPETSIRLHVETRDTKQPFMYVFAEPVTEERADQIQNVGTRYARDWARRVVGVGKNDPEAEEEWQDLQEEVDEQVTEDGTADKDVKSTAIHQEEKPSVEGEAATEGESTTQNETAAEGETTIHNETAAENETLAEGETTAENEAAVEEAEVDKATLSPPTFEKETTSGGPLMGWTVTIRNKVNGHYLPRPEQLEPEDNWEIEYNIQDIEETSVWQLYNAIKERRRQLVGLSDDESNKGLENYRKVIQRYASRGSKWRARQDQLDEERGVQMYEPLGPGSAGFAERLENEIASATASEAPSEATSETVVQSKE